MPEGTRARNRREVRQRIETVALRLYRERGFDATSVAAIAEESAVSPATFFRYFATKESVVLEALAEEVPRVREAARACIDPADLRGSLVPFVRRLCDEWEADAESVRALVELLRGNASLVPVVLTARERWQHALAEELGALQHREPTLSDRAYAATVLGVLSVAMDTWRAGGGPLPDLAVEALVAVLDLAPAA